MELNLNIIVSLMLVVTAFCQVEDSNQNNDYYRRHFQCPDAWVQRCNQCFLYVNQPMQWVDAQYYCRRLGGDLVTIRNWATNYFMYRIVRHFDRRRRTIWIGANDRRSEGTFEWSDGTRASRYSFRWFAPGEPDDKSPGQDCVELQTRGRRRLLWYDHFCGEEQPFICQANACYEGQYRCDNGKCITKYAVCDRVNDCGDNSDERNCKHCGGKLEGTNGTFTSPEYPNFYPSDSDCTWKITVPLKSKVELSFRDIQVEPGFDYVDVYDGPSSSSKIIARLMGLGKVKPLLSSGNQMMVRFVSDESIENRGFFANFKAVTDASCGGALKVAKGQLREIISPKYPLHYPTNSKCTWTVTADANSVLSLRFVDFETEPINDVVDVVDGVLSTDKLIARMSGAQTGKTFFSTGAGLTLKFTSDHAIARRGFKAVLFGGCSIALNASKGFISSPGFGYKNYPDMMDCTWKINEPNGRNVDLLFHFFDTELYFDVVNVLNGETGASIRKYSGELARLTSESWMLETASSSLDVNFKSDYSYNKKGFRISFSIGCPKLPVPTHGSLSTVKTNFGSVVTYSCNKGYRLVGSTTRTCLFGGTWSVGSTKCQEIICGPPGTIANGVYHINGSYNFNSTATYSCFGGFRLEGTQVRRCQENGLWSGILPTCKNVGCGDPGTPANGARSSSNTKVGAVISFTCNFGYQMLGPKGIFCDADGKWSGPIPTCQAVFCAVVPPPVNGRYVLGVNVTVPAKIQYGSGILSFACNKGFFMRGSQSIICQADGSFNDTAPLCSDTNECNNMVCKGPGAVCTNTHGSFSCSCKAGFQKMRGSADTCEDIDECSVRNGGCNQNCTNTPRSYVCSCNEGYYLYDGAGEFVPEAVVNHTCLGIKCQSPPPLMNGVRAFSSTRYPAVAISQCNRGFLITGPKEIRCTKSGSWSGGYAACNVVDCGDAGVTVNAITNVTSGSGYMSKISTECLHGYVRESGSSERTCMANDTHAFWTGDPLVCRRISCGRLPNIANGKLEYSNGTLFGDKITYECQPGYNLTGGSMERICTARGIWTGTEPYCQALPCPDPGVPKFGKRRGILIIGETVAYSCTPGFSLSGDANRTCSFVSGEGLVWSGALPQCKDSLPPSFGNTCPNSSVVVLPKGEATVYFSWIAPRATDNSGMRPNVTVTQNLKSPVLLGHGPMAITYLAEDAEGNVANCTFVATVEDREPPVLVCPKNVNISHDLPVVVHWGQGYARDNTAISSIVFNPPNGTTFQSDSRNAVTMNATDIYGNWASCILEVFVRGCGCPSNRICSVHPGNGTAVCHVNLPPISCNIFCNKDYTIADKNVSSLTIHCPGGNWTQPSPGCALKKLVTVCLEFTTKIVYPTSALQHLTSSGQLFSRSDALVAYLTNRQLPECADMQMSRFTIYTSTSATFNIVTKIRASFKASVAVQNITNLRLTTCINALKADVASLQSNYTAQFAPFGPANCQSVAITEDKLCCERTASGCCPSNQVYIKTAVVGTDYCYACTPGMYFSSTDQNCLGCPMNTYQSVSGEKSCIQCPAGSGTLRTHSKKCLEFCKAGTFSYDGFGPVCRPCPVGEYQSSQKSTRCEKCPSGMSTKSTGATSVAKCVESCAPGNISDDGYSPCKQCPIGTYQPNAGRVVCYPCPGGGKFGGQAGAVSVSECPTNDSCYASPCQNNGTCVPGEFAYTCQCADGYTGSNCGVDIDECASTPCQNGGNCTNLVNSYTCTCPPGFTGSNCEIDINECESQPCLYGGTCVDGVNSITCICRPGFTGEFCQIDINECVPDSCQNGATCLNLVNRYLCLCLPGYYGVHCQNETNECLSSPCRNNATCIDLVNSFRCECQPGFAGSICEVDIDECLTEPCANNGTCLDGINDYRCICQAGYTGKNCTVDIDECASLPCKNGASCTDLVNNFECTCAVGYTGESCDVDIDECVSSPCKNNATCIDQVNSYNCTCLSGFYGEHCENETNECVPDPCVYGDCIDLVADYRCNCMAGFTAKDCNVNIDECASLPCNNSGNCTDFVNGYNCTCAPGYTGVNCETDIDECYPDPCRGNAYNCTDMINGFYCQCKPGYRGQSCEIEIDYCTPNPCMYNSSCLNVKDSASFQCICTDGYQGDTCQTEINECASNPCQNGGTCLDLVAAYTCTCPLGFTGARCEINIDDCITRNGSLPCLNGGTCLDGINSYQCRCPITHTGLKCQKAKSPRFDLRFHGGSGSYLSYSNYTSAPAVTVASWVRFLGKSSAGTFLMLANVVNSSYHDVLLEIENRFVRFTHSGGSRVTHPFTKPLNDGLWHHLIVSFDPATGRAQIYKDKEVVFDSVENGLKGRKIFDPKGMLVLGQQISTTGSVISSSFVGEIGQVGVWSRVLSSSERSSLTANCSTNLTDTLRSWIHLSGSKGPNVTIVEPTTCGSNTCPPSFIGQFCETEIDKEAPKVVSCPNVTKVITPSRLSIVSWTLPVFSDNKAVISVTASHRSGSYLAWGDYVVTYIASDASGNSASCTIELYVMRYNCVLLKPPRNGAAFCGSWDYGRFCDAKCYPNHAFAVRHPPYYSCGQSGAWSHGPPTFPENPQNLLPACALMAAATTTTSNKVTYSASSCDQAFIAQFRREFEAKINTIQKYFPICGASCDFSQTSIKCDGAARKRRSTGGASAIITVDFQVNTTSADNYTQQVQSGLKNGQFNLTVSVNNVTVNLTNNDIKTTVSTTCAQGSVLQTQTKNCIICPAGTYNNVSGNQCLDCPIGTYQQMDGSVNCTTCPSGTTTFSVATNQSSACKEICAAGSFFNSSADKCQQCPEGFYQNSTGQMQCDYCPSGLSSSKGAKSVTDCVVKCGLGSQLATGDVCQLCPYGSYRDVVNQTSCVSCPVTRGIAITTYILGAKSVSSCKAVCPRGKEVSKDGMKCMHCQTGSYRENLLLPYCVICQVGSTTKVPGSVASANCSSLQNTKMESVGLRFSKEVWNSKLSDVNSTEFRDLATKVSKAIEKTYATESGFLSVKINQFKNGSVIAFADLVFASSVSDPLNLLKAAVTSGSIGTLSLDSTYKIVDHCRLFRKCGANQECRSNATHVYCACVTGYFKPSASSDCAVDCVTSFCLNGGKCERGPNYRVCRCPSGYSGNRCQNEGNNKTGLIVGLVVAGLLLLIIVAILVWKKKQRRYDVNKGVQLDNNVNVRNSPDYPMKTYTNPGMKKHDDVSASGSNTPMSVRAFSNKVAVDSVEADETGALRMDEKDV